MQMKIPHLRVSSRALAPESLSHGRGAGILVLHQGQVDSNSPPFLLNLPSRCAKKGPGRRHRIEGGHKREQRLNRRGQGACQDAAGEEREVRLRCRTNFLAVDAKLVRIGCTRSKANIDSTPTIAKAPLLARALQHRHWCMPDSLDKYIELCHAHEQLAQFHSTAHRRRDLPPDPHTQCAT